MQCSSIVKEKYTRISRWVGILELILFIIISQIHIHACPFNKVEESFNTQAVYDVINSPLSPSQDDDQHYQWDHEQFPGVVPRTFLGAVAIGCMGKIFKLALFPYISNRSNSQLYLQFISRSILASMMAVSLCCLTRAIQRRYQLKTRILFDLVMVTQFHYMFYSSRFLPNTYAAILTNLVLASWLDSQYNIMIPCIATSVLVFRFDSILFFGWIIIVGLVLRNSITFQQLLTIGIPSGIIILATTISVDSYFWGRLLWPEGEGIYFNVWLNKSHEWGTQPYFWYFNSCLPRLILTGLLYLVFASRFSILNLLLPTLAFIATYSILPHKELRFIIYIVPALNIVVADGLSNIDWLFINFKYSTSDVIDIKDSKKENPVYMLYILIRLFKRLFKVDTKQTSNIQVSYYGRYLEFIFIILIFITIVSNALFTIISLTASSYNYPGGHCSLWLNGLSELIQVGQSPADNYKISVYANNLAAQTGLTRFLQMNHVDYFKDAYLDADSTLSRKYSNVFLMLEPDEVSKFELDFCDGQKLSGNQELKCKHDSLYRYCCIVHTEKMFDSVSINTKNMISSLTSVRSFMGIMKDIIRTKEALKILRCGLTSKFNPFSY